MRRDSPELAAEETLAALPEGSRFYVLFPADAGLFVELNGSGETRRHGDAETRRNGRSPRPPVPVSPRHLIAAHVMSLMQRGFTRLLHDGKQIDLSSPDDYLRDDFEDVYVLVDRLTAREDIRQRLVDSLETCFREGHGQAVVELADGTQLSNPLSARGEGPTRLRFSERFECKYDGTVYATVSFTRHLSRGFSASTIRSAHAQRARDSATRLDSISIW